ncbi:hypothetical protein WR25_11469 [Diploscapter pachys]|uniref:Uncharacterized protein n=1 Tax=Diploscapter pachys TaxID=2018661 RepID=A0A2A2J5Y7_9BILA|nr:hypothetical protein WR25_11469 [Diploscapter pachys]
MTSKFSYRQLREWKDNATSHVNKLMQLNYLKGARLSEAGTVKMLGLLKILAKTHAVIGLMSMVLACLADYISTRVNTIRIHGIIECCSFYFFLTGFMTRLGTDYRLDAGLIALSICELIIAIISATVSSKTLCGTPKTPPMEMAPLNGAATSDSTAVQN